MLDVVVSEDKIVCQINSFYTKDYHVNCLLELEDIIVSQWNGQAIVFEDHDGNDINLGQFRAWVNRLQSALGLSYDRIIFNTQIPPIDPYHWINKHDFYRICDIDYNSLNKDLSGARFVGCLCASRYSMARVRTIYELGQRFGDDSFITCRPRIFVNHLAQTNAEYFAKEIDWFNNRYFNNDLADENNNAFNSYTASLNYASIWNRFQIEVVCETDEYMSQRLTDKVAKPLASGKPFVLVCGQNSLKHLRNLGFVTFSDFIDESYDQCVLPAQRIQKIMTSLGQLYNSPGRDAILAKMHEHAVRNIEVYHRVTPYQGKYGATYTEFPRIY